MALIWAPFPDSQEATEVARKLAAENLIACANIIPAITSVFAWQGTLHETHEAAMLCKTSASLLEGAIARLAELHSYDTPAISGWLADHTAPATLGWLNETLARKIGV